MIMHESHLEAFSPMQMDDFNINIILCVPYHFTLSKDSSHNRNDLC